MPKASWTIRLIKYQGNGACPLNSLMGEGLSISSNFQHLQDAFAKWMLMCFGNTMEWRFDTDVQDCIKKSAKQYFTNVTDVVMSLSTMRRSVNVLGNNCINQYEIDTCRSIINSICTYTGSQSLFVLAESIIDLETSNILLWSTIYDQIIRHEQMCIQQITYNTSEIINRLTEHMLCSFLADNEDAFMLQCRVISVFFFACSTTLFRFQVNLGFE